MSRSGPRWIGWPSAPGCRRRGSPNESGLDPTTFNKSKRVTADGRERWPSTESIAKALAATNSSIDSFVQLIGDGARTGAVGAAARFRAGRQAAAISTTAAFRPARAGTRSALPSASDEHAYALEISGDAMRPAYRDGDVIVVSPAHADPARRPRGGENERRRGDGARN